jgi:hypothetical protein
MAEDFGKLDDSELIDLVYDRLLRNDTPPQEFREHARFVYAIRDLQDQVCNGGFVQYFWNTGGELIAQAIAGARAIGAEEVHALIDQAAKLHARQPRHIRETEVAFRRTGQGDYQSYRTAQPELESLDERFYEQLGDLESKLATYVRENLPVFDLN